MVTHSSILAWKFHRERSLVSYSPCGRKELDVAEPVSTYTHIIKYSHFVHCILTYVTTGSLCLLSIFTHFTHRQSPTFGEHQSLLCTQRLVCCCLNSTYNRDHMAFVFLCLTYFTKHDLKFHPHCGKWKGSVPFYGWIVFQWVHTRHLYPLFQLWTLQ